MSDDPLERLRIHLEHHKHREQAFFSTAGLQKVLDLVQTLMAENLALTAQRNALKVQVERLLLKKSDEISQKITGD